MKNIVKFRFTVLLALLSLSLTIYGQDELGELITVPLSSPNSPGHLVARCHDGSIEVEGYDGNEVQVYITTISKNGEHNKYASSGLKRIPNTSIKVSIVEVDNVVKVSGNNQQRANFKIKVPRQFSVSVGTHHNGDILISGVRGEVDAGGHHGGIRVLDVEGSVVANTHHGEIEVVMNSISANKPMAFTTYHGNVDITFPQNANGDVKMKSTKGDIYTDFEVNLQKKVPELTKKSNRQEIKLTGWNYGSIGSGGPEFMFTTYHGDIIIRKK